MYTYLFYTFSAANGACLIRSEIASVSVQEENFGAFVYITGENNASVWPSKYFISNSFRSVFRFEAVYLFSL